MIKIDMLEPDDPDWAKWLLDCKNETIIQINERNNGNKPKFKNGLYKKKKRFFYNKKGPFKGKCAYCEARIKDGKNCDIDHYRPKGGVTYINDEPVMIKNRAGAIISHPGYYWLAYDWHNLLPACKFCNQATKEDYGTEGKRNRFPVVGKHAENPGEESIEQPLLLNPVIDDPREHISIDTKTGVLKYLTPRGKATIDTLGLNTRDDLADRRKAVIYQFMAYIIEFSFACRSHDRRTREKAKAKINKFLQGQEEFSFGARTYYEEYMEYLR